jgi:hypothetical protein
MWGAVEVADEPFRGVTRAQTVFEGDADRRLTPRTELRGKTEFCIRESIGYA